MSTSATVDVSLSGTLVLKGNAGLVTPSVSLVFGQGNWAQMRQQLTYGTGAQQIKNLWWAQRTVAAGLNDNLDLSGMLNNDFDQAIAFNAIKLLIVSIVSPDGTKKIQVGPLGVTNAFAGKWGGVTATYYDEIFAFNTIINHPWAGYPVVAGTADMLGIKNPTAGSVTYNIAIGGVTP